MSYSPIMAYGTLQQYGFYGLVSLLGFLIGRRVGLPNSILTGPLLATAAVMIIGGGSGTASAAVHHSFIPVGRWHSFRTTGKTGNSKKCWFVGCLFFGRQFMSDSFFLACRIWVNFFCPHRSYNRIFKYCPGRNRRNGDYSHCCSS